MLECSGSVAADSADWKVRTCPYIICKSASSANAVQIIEIARCISAKCSHVQGVGLQVTRRAAAASSVSCAHYSLVLILIL